MFLRRKSGTTFFCFSPPVMIATCIVEISMFLYMLWRYKFTTLTRLAAGLLLLLATFQLAEFHVCTGTSALIQWSHIGYVAITLLPALGIHAITILQGKKPRRSGVVWAAYGSAVAFVAYFALTANSIQGHACYGNYVMFRIEPSLTWLYFIYYYGWIITGIVLSLKFGARAKQRKVRQALYGFAAGYTAFLVPTTTVNLLNHATTNGIPSIMCGFAVLFAFIVTVYVMPRAGVQKLNK